MKTITIAIVLCIVSAQFGSEREDCDDERYEDYDRDNRREGNRVDSRRRDDNDSNGRNNGWKDKNGQDSNQCTANKALKNERPRHSNAKFCARKENT